MVDRGGQGRRGRCKTSKLCRSRRAVVSWSPHKPGGGGVGECEPSEADEPASAMMRGRDQEASRRSGVTLAAVTVLGLGPWGDASSCGGCSGSHLLALA
jgi:hypothetical protein